MLAESCTDKYDIVGCNIAVGVCLGPVTGDYALNTGTSAELPVSSLIVTPQQVGTFMISRKNAIMWKTAYATGSLGEYHFLTYYFHISDALLRFIAKYLSKQDVKEHLGAGETNFTMSSHTIGENFAKSGDVYRGAEDYLAQLLERDVRVLFYVVRGRISPLQYLLILTKSIRRASMISWSTT